jgi:hypothetical protein
MSDFCIDNNNIIDSDSNNFCINDFDFGKAALIKPPQGKKQKLAQKFIFIDSLDYKTGSGVNTTHYSKFSVVLDEVIKDVVEIELMSFHLPQHSSSAPSNPVGANSVNYGTNKYLLLNIDNINLPNYKICEANSLVSTCFSRLPIPGTYQNVFFGRIKNFTNVFEYKPILQSLNRLDINVTDKSGNEIEDLSKAGFTLTLGITYQTQPDLFD